MDIPLLIYGTLRHAPLLEALIGGSATAEAAHLPDHHVLTSADGTFPVLRQRTGARAEGLLLTGLTAAQRTALDSYETPFGYAPRDVVVEVDGALTPAAAYFPDDTVVASDTPWSLRDWVQTRSDIAITAAREIASHDPPLTPGSLKRQWSMIQTRAEAAVRAAASTAPATRRYAAQSGDFAVPLAAPPMGEFFKYAKLNAGHRRFDGAYQSDLPREVFVGVDAALVLPYDPVRDRVLLIEQFRVGPARRGDLNPWSLEPVAGIVDAGETPERAARREAAEEAGLNLAELTSMFGTYPSPGASTDYFHCFLGLTELPSNDITHGGLACEHEDLRRHVMTLDDALALMDSGEIDTGPLIAMLLWTLRYRHAKA